jgi:hypothetical protein
MSRVLLVLFLASCADEGAALDDMTVVDLSPPVGEDATVPLFDHTLFDSSHRTNRMAVTLPDGLFSSVILHLQLSCPTICDAWDRIGSLGVVEPAAYDGGAEPYQEVARFITPFGVGGKWDLDVTDLQPLLRGDRTLRATIDTWVQAGSSYGNGWLLTASLDYQGGVPDAQPVAVLPLAWSDFPIGDPSQPVSKSLSAQPVVLPDGATRATVRVLVTGHGQGNQDDCGEFCSLGHHVLRDGAEAAGQMIWRDDCASNPVSGQHGTWQYARAGWCPGSTVTPWRVDLGATPSSFLLGYALDDYVNGCSPTSCQPTHCALGTSCAFDSGNHTPPFYALSALVIAYR